MNPIPRRSALKALAALSTFPLLARSAAAASSAFGDGNFKLGLVTYNLAKDWDVPTIIKNCEATGFDALELRTTHRHGVEPTLEKAARATRCAKSRRRATRCGSCTFTARCGGSWGGERQGVRGQESGVSDAVAPESSH